MGDGASDKQKLKNKNKKKFNLSHLASNMENASEDVDKVQDDSSDSNASIASIFDKEEFESDEKEMNQPYAG